VGTREQRLEVLCSVCSIIGPTSSSLKTQRRREVGNFIHSCGRCPLERKLVGCRKVVESCSRALPLLSPIPALDDEVSPGRPCSPATSFKRSRYFPAIAHLQKLSKHYHIKTEVNYVFSHARSTSIQRLTSCMSELISAGDILPIFCDVQTLRRMKAPAWNAPPLILL
jgi:hypothetical protein